MENLFEKLLWYSRHSMLIAVITALAAAVLVLVGTLVDMLHLIHATLGYLVQHDPAQRHAMMFAVVELLDGYLMAGVLFIFSFGLYELFISKLDAAQASAQKGKILNIRGIDDLKKKLGKVILMMLIIRIFASTFDLEVNTMGDLLAFAGVVLLIALALYFTNSKSLPKAKALERSPRATSREDKPDGP